MDVENSLLMPYDSKSKIDKLQRENHNIFRYKYIECKRHIEIVKP